MQLINFNNSFRYQHKPGLDMRAQSAIMDVALDPAVPILALFPGLFKQGWEQGTMSVLERVHFRIY